MSQSSAWMTEMSNQMKGSGSSPSGGELVIQDQTNPAFDEAPIEIRTPVPPPKPSKKVQKANALANANAEAAAAKAAAEAKAAPTKPAPESLP